MKVTRLLPYYCGRASAEINTLTDNSMATEISDELAQSLYEVAISLKMSAEAIMRIIKREEE